MMTDRSPKYILIFRALPHPLLLSTTHGLQLWMLARQATGAARATIQTFI